MKVTFVKQSREQMIAQLYDMLNSTPKWKWLRRYEIKRWIKFWEQSIK